MASTSRDPGCGGALCALARRFCALLPRRVAEPTGPLDVILDILLGLVVAKGASRAQLAQLPCEVVSRECASTDDRCAICLGAFEPGDVCRVLACSHRFHAEVSYHRPHAPLPSRTHRIPRVRTDPSTNSAFVTYTKCIDCWLVRKSLCPTCKADVC